MTTANSSRIVLIDDEPGVLKALTLLLQALGHSVMAFAGPQEALAYLRAGIDADLILSDQRMPGMAGSDLFRTLRAHSIETPFVLMSGHANEDDVRHVLVAPATSFLPKPFTPATLQEAIQSALLSGIPAKAV